MAFRNPFEPPQANPFGGGMAGQVPAAAPVARPPAQIPVAQAPMPEMGTSAMPNQRGDKRYLRPTTMKVLIFSFSADGLHICESDSALEVAKARGSYFGRLVHHACERPDFWSILREQILSQRPNICVFGTQDEPSSGTYFHSHFLPKMMPGLNYQQILTDKLSHVGTLPSGLSIARRDVSDESSRSSIYALRDDAFVIEENESEFKEKLRSFDLKTIETFTSTYGERRAGASCCYVNYPAYGRMAFINVNLPDSRNKLEVPTGRMTWESYRARIQLADRLFLSEMLDKFVNSLDLSVAPQHVFLFGDFNTEISGIAETPATVISQISQDPNGASLKYLAYDEMKKLMNEYPLVGYSEGANNEGPRFPPTWRWNRGRPEECGTQAISNLPATTCFSTLPDGKGYPGWRDRILYRSTEGSYRFSANVYSSINTGTLIRSSQHAGVVGLFTLYT